jgi:hypothetical protein
MSYAVPIMIEEEGKIEGLNLEDHTFLTPFFQFDLCSSLAVMRSSLYWVQQRIPVSKETTFSLVTNISCRRQETPLVILGDLLGCLSYQYQAGSKLTGG